MSIIARHCPRRLVPVLVIGLAAAALVSVDAEAGRRRRKPPRRVDPSVAGPAEKHGGIGGGMAFSARGTLLTLHAEVQQVAGRGQ